MIQILHNQPVKTFDAAAAATGAGVPFALPARAGALQWQTFFGTNPATVVIDLEMSLDNVHWDAVDSTTVVGGEIRTFTIIGGKFVRGNITTITGAGDEVTMIIVCD